MVEPGKVKILSIVYDDGDELLGGFKKALSENNVQKCRIISVEGKIKNLDINIFVGGAFTPRHLDEEYRLTSIHGIFFEKGNLGYKGEMTVSLAGEGHKMLGGDLIQAKVSGAVTIKAEVLESK